LAKVAGAGDHELRRPANKAGHEYRQWRGKLVSLAAERVRRLEQLLRHAHQVFTSAVSRYQ
jgi:hypothetical protein